MLRDVGLGILDCLLEIQEHLRGIGDLSLCLVPQSYLDFSIKRDGDQVDNY